MKINLYEPGALDELFRVNRERYGDLRMMAEDDDGDDGDPGDDGDDDPDPDDDDDSDDDDDPDKPYVAPDKAAWDKTQRKLKRQEERITRLLGKRTPAKKTAAPAGKGKGSVDDQLLALLRKGKDTQDDPEPDDDDDGPNWKDVAITNAAAAQIAAAGFNGTAKQAARLARLIDRSGIEPDRHGVFDLEDEIDELKDEYPQLFAQAGGNGRRAPRLRTVASSGTPKKTGTESTTDKMLKRAGYR